MAEDREALLQHYRATRTELLAALDEIVAPTIATLAAEGMPYSGVLYAGQRIFATRQQAGVRLQAP